MEQNKSKIENQNPVLEPILKFYGFSVKINMEYENNKLHEY
jgi:hypothetical protein